MSVFSLAKHQNEFEATSVVHRCKSTTEYDRREDPLDCGPRCRGGNCGGDLEAESSLVLAMLSELLSATARAKVLRLEMIGRFDIPQPLLRLLSHT